MRGHGRLGCKLLGWRLLGWRLLPCRLLPCRLVLAPVVRPPLVPALAPAATHAYRRDGNAVGLEQARQACVWEPALVCVGRRCSSVRHQQHSTRPKRRPRLHHSLLTLCPQALTHAT